METSANMHQQPGSSSQQSKVCRVPPKLDAKIGGLAGICIFGFRAVEAVMMGLSRPFHATTEDVSSLIAEWERRDKECCYQGSVQDLLSLTDTMIFAISYRHAERKDWYRKGPDSICKFQSCDEELFTTAVERLGKTFPKIMVWCDQVLATRLEFDENNFRWYQVGLLPYMTFLVLQLSPHIPEELLEKRVWIRVERSLGRMAYGFIKADEAARNVLQGHPGNCLHGWECMKDACKHVLSGYWPEDRTVWKEDFQRMKQWMLGVLCRGNSFFHVPVFHVHERVDNTEILSSLGEFATIPLRMKDEESFIFTEDKRFYLKGTAWNLSLRGIWEKNTRYISHYMGRLEDTRFSWWQCEELKVLFGCITNRSHATTILAVEMNRGYLIFRGAGDRLLYAHAESIAGPNTKEQIRRAAQKAKIHLQQDLEWKLLYCSNSSDLNEVRSVEEILSALEGQETKAEVLVGQIFRGTTTNLFKCAVAKPGGDAHDVARRISQCVTEWNEHVKRTYTDCMTVRDTTLGPVWLEGFNQEKLSFGFFEFLTNALVLNRRSMSGNTVQLADSKDVIREVRKLRVELGENERCLAAEFFDNGDNQLSRRDVVRYTLCGGFGKTFKPYGFTAFLNSLARSKNYWQTMVFCRNGAMQIRFVNAAGEKRIAQRKTTMQAYSAHGVVHPDDYEEVKKISMCYDTSNDEHLMMVYWNEMEDTTTRGEMWRVLKSSKQMFEGREVLLADMTIGEREEGGLQAEGDMYRDGQDPLEMMKQNQRGEAEGRFRYWEEREARDRVDFDETVAQFQASIDRSREAQLRAADKD